MLSVSYATVPATTEAAAPTVAAAMAMAVFMGSSFLHLAPSK